MPLNQSLTCMQVGGSGMLAVHSCHCVQRNMTQLNWFKVGLHIYHCESQ